jgi:hypothetical protein
MTQPASPPPGAAPLPGWLGPVVTLTTQVGVPTVVAGVLLYFVLFRVDGAMKVIQENEETRTKIIAAMQETLIATLNTQTDKFVRAIDANIAANRELAARYERSPPTTRRPGDDDR